MIGSIVAVCTSVLGGIPKYPQPFVTIGKWGLEKDYHNREMRKSFSKPGTTKPNIDRHVLLVAAEVEEQLGREFFRKPLEPGKLSENITTRGFGDLSWVKPNLLVAIDGGRIMLRTGGQEIPCKHVTNVYGIKFAKAIRGRRGVICIIEKGFGEKIFPEQQIEIVGGGEAVAGAPSPQDPALCATAEFETA